MSEISDPSILRWGDPAPTEVESYTPDDPKKRVRNFFVTVQYSVLEMMNTDTLKEYLLLNIPLSWIRFAVWQKEIGADGGNVHYHVILQLKTPRQWRTIHACLPGARVEVTHSVQAAIKYCTKEETRVVGTEADSGSFGEAVVQGQRSDLSQVARYIDTAMDSGESWEDIQWEIGQRWFGLWLRYQSSLTKWMTLAWRRNVRTLEEDVRVVVYHGPTGSGKSRRALQKFPGLYHSMIGAKWWDEYHGQKVVLWDDFDGSWMKITKFLHLVNRFPIRVEYKGSSFLVRWDTLVITSNLSPSQWWSNARDVHKKALYRRCNEVFFCDVGKPPVQHTPGNGYGAETSTVFDVEARDTMFNF